MTPQTTTGSAYHPNPITSRLDLADLKQHIAILEAKLDTKSSSPTTDKCATTTPSTAQTTPLNSEHHFKDLPNPAAHPPRPSTPPIFNGSQQAFKAWQAEMYAKLSSMQSSTTEETKIEYVLSRLSNEVFDRLTETFPLIDGRGCRSCSCSCSARQMVRNLAQYYDEDVRKVDLRFGCC